MNNQKQFCSCCHVNIEGVAVMADPWGDDFSSPYCSDECVEHHEELASEAADL